MNFVTIVGIIFLSFGILMVVISAITTVKAKAKYTEAVTATCVDLKKRESHDEDGFATTLYRPVFKYYFNGTEYVSEPRSSYTNIDVTPVGKSRTIRIDPARPEKIYLPSLKVWLTYVIIGIVFIATGLYVLLAMPPIPA